MVNLCSICISLLTLSPNAKPCKQCSRDLRFAWEYVELPASVNAAKEIYEAEKLVKRAFKRYERDRIIAAKRQADIISANKLAKNRRQIIRNRATRRLVWRMARKRYNPPLA